MKCNEKRGYFKRKIASFSILRANNDKNKQLLLLRKICPHLKELLIARIYEIVQEKGERWQFAEMRWGDAMDIFKEAQRKGLNVIIEEVGRN